MKISKNLIILSRDDDQSFYNEDWADNTKLANTLQVTALKLHKKCNDTRLEAAEHINKGNTESVMCDVIK